MDFVEYIKGLAEEGETVLLVRQRPVKSNGLPAYHADGTPKYTWPAFLPESQKRGARGAWYMNTGSFIVDRFKDGKPTASASNCEYVLCMMLDDIGTKATTPPLEPTWIMETSEGSYQWGYAFSEQPTKGEFTAAMRAIADAGYTDPGATNAVRNFRIPGSINLKPGRNEFAARLVEFHPDREFTLSEICNALGVVPRDADTAAPVAFKLRDTGTDSVLEWLNGAGLVLSSENAEGWLGVVCPNHVEHTDGQIEARYMPLNRAFCCYHAHCEHLDSRTFLNWVHENGGPKVEPGLREELLTEHMDRALSKLTPTVAYPDEAQRVIADVERREAGRIERSEWFGRYAYIMADDSYFDIEERRELSRQTFNAVYRHVPCKSIHTGRRIEASVCYDENRQELGGRALSGITFAAGEDVLVSKDGEVYANRWRDARPKVASASDVTPWLEHCRAMVPDEDELNHCFDAMAFKLQNPHVKINHAILHGGDEGCGKDTMWAPFIWSVCGPAKRNFGLIDNESLSSQWGYQLESEILVLNELKEPDAYARRQLANKLKPVIAAPPETIVINRKGLHPYSMLNRMFVLAFTNDPVPISIPSQDRRWFAIWSSAPRMDPDRAGRLWRWYEQGGGYEAVAAWLHTRDVSQFNPAAAPMWTEFKASMVEQGMSIAESYLVEMIRARRGEFARGVIGGPFHNICDRVAGMMPSGVKVPQAALLHALKEAGWQDMGRIGSFDLPTKRHVYAAPDMALHKKSDLRRMVEDEPPSSNVVGLRR